MSDMKFNWKNFFSINGPEHRLSLDEYNGNISFNVWTKENSGNRGPVLKISLDPSTCKIIKNTLVKLKESAPGTSLSFIKKKWDQEAKSFKETMFIMGFIKDDKNIFHIELTSKDLKNGAKFALTSASGVAIGSNDLSASDRSMIGLDLLLDLFNRDIPQIKLLSRLNYVPPTFNKGGNKPNNSDSGSEDSGIFG